MSTTKYALFFIAEEESTALTGAIFVYGKVNVYTSNGMTPTYELIPYTGSLNADNVATNIFEIKQYISQTTKDDMKNYIIKTMTFIEADKLLKQFNNRSK